MVSLLSKGFQESSPTPQLESINSLLLYLLYSPALTTICHHHDYKYHGRVTSLLFNTLLRFVIVFLKRSNCLLISQLQSPSVVILEPKKTKSITTSTFSPSICHEVMGSDAMILVFLIFSFKPALSLSSFTLIKRFFSSSSLSAFRVASFADLRLLMFLPSILIPACNSSSWAFHMMYSVYRLNRVTADSPVILLS